VRAEHILRVLEVVFLRALWGFIKEEVTEKRRKLSVEMCTVSVNYFLDNNYQISVSKIQL